MNEQQRIERLEDTMPQRVEVLQSLMKRMDTGFEKTDTNFKILNEKVNEIQNALEDHKGTTKSGFKAVTVHLDSIQESLENIQKASGFDEQMDNLKLIQGGK